MKYYLERGLEVNNALHYMMLQDKLKPTIQSKHQGLSIKGVLLLHDNTYPHAVQKQEREILKYSYGFQLAPSDSQLFGHLKYALRGYLFTMGREWKDAVHTWLKS